MLGNLRNMRLWIPLLLLITGCGHLTASAPGRNPEIFQKLSLAKEFIYERNFKAAQKALEDALIIEPDNPIVLYNLARLLKEQRGREDQSKEFLNKALKLSETCGEVDRYHFNLLFPRKSDRNRLEELLVEGERLKQKFPHDFLVHYSMGLLYYDMMKWEPAIENMERALRLFPDLPQANNLLGYLYSFLGDEKNAIRHMADYARAFPQRANPHDSLGEIYLLTGKYDEAIKEFQAALEIAPGFNDVRYHLIAGYVNKGQYKNALEQSYILLENSEADYLRARALSSISYICLEANHLEKAAQKIDSALELRPEDIHFLAQKGYIQLKKGQLEEVQHTLYSMKKVLKKDVNKSSPQKFQDMIIPYFRLQAQTNFSLGNFETAVKLLTKLNDDTSNPFYSLDIRAELSEAYFSQGQFKVCLELIQSVLELNPNHLRTLLLQGKVYTALSRNREAGIAFDRCRVIMSDADPNSPVLDEISDLQRMAKIN